MVAAAAEQSPTYLTDQLAQQVVRDQPRLALKNLSLNLATFLAEGESSVDQTLTQYRYSTMAEASAPLDVASFESKRRNDNDELSLSIKTKDGDTVTFSFRYEAGFGGTDTQQGVGYQSLTVSYELDGELSEKEIDELAGLSEGLNALANSYFSGAGAQLADLQLDQLSTVAELSLSLEGVGPGDIKLSMTDNDLLREYRIQMNGDTVEMSRDKLSLLGSSGSQRREAALNHYRQMLIEGVERSHGGAGQQALMLDAFNLLHGENSDTENTFDLTDAESSLLTGLADFSFSFEGRARQSAANPLFGGLVEQMSLSLSQETRIRIDGPLTRTVDQRQNWMLKSSYFEPLPHLDSADFENHNYSYVSLEEQAQVRNQVSMTDGRMSALQTQRFDSERNEMVFIEGELADWKTTRQSLHEIRDLTARLRSQSDNFDGILLEEILLDPKQMAQRAATETLEHDLSSAS
ncbi:hypothetical protein ABMA57_07045 [Saccharospirillum sp. HFRX-1]|uniref:hypothetical protein n=1 Tax=unclassified Saccharospirillum TaxID=2633430 RepID=UPI00371829A0